MFLIFLNWQTHVYRNDTNAGQVGEEFYYYSSGETARGGLVHKIPKQGIISISLSIFLCSRDLSLPFHHFDCLIVIYLVLFGQNDYYNMMNGPIEPQLMFAIKTHKAQKQQNQHDPQMAMETTSSSSGTITQVFVLDITFKNLIGTKKMYIYNIGDVDIKLASQLIAHVGKMVMTWR